MATHGANRSFPFVVTLVGVIGLAILVNGVRQPTRLVNQAQESPNPVVGVDELEDEAVIDSVQSEFPDVHFLFGDVTSRTVTKTPNGYRMDAQAIGTLEFVLYAHSEDLTEDGWVMEVLPDTTNTQVQEFVAVKEGVEMRFKGTQTSPDEVAFELELSK